MKATTKHAAIICYELNQNATTGFEFTILPQVALECLTFLLLLEVFIYNPVSVCLYVVACACMCARACVCVCVCGLVCVRVSLCLFACVGR